MGEVWIDGFSIVLVVKRSSLSLKLCKVLGGSLIIFAVESYSLCSSL